MRTCFEVAELYDLTRTHCMPEIQLKRVFDEVVYPTIAESPIIAEKYPDPADRTPHKLLGGLGNIVSIEYMQSLEPHDPRRLFLDTLKAPDEQRCAELERNALLIDKAVTERVKCAPGEFSLRSVLLEQVCDDLESNYLTTLRTAKISELLWYYVKNNGVDNDDGEYYVKSLAKADQNLVRRNTLSDGNDLINRVNML
eukprot:gene9386-11049_t